MRHRVITERRVFKKIKIENAEIGKNEKLREESKKLFFKN